MHVNVGHHCKSHRGLHRWRFELQVVDVTSARLELRLLIGHVLPSWQLESRISWRNFLRCSQYGHRGFSNGLESAVDMSVT